MGGRHEAVPKLQDESKVQEIEEVQTRWKKKQILRAKLAADVQKFLDDGGLIQKIEFGISGGSDHFHKLVSRAHLFGDPGAAMGD